ncbi:MAG: NAD-glutamate dehydrogenase [Azospirillum sp.]|nr:NAD-glutamate dehydrogenase [Azospirillum sp.]
MALRAAQLKAELIEEAVRLVQDRLPPDKATMNARFLRLFYAHVPPDDIASLAPEQVYGGALALLQFAGQRAPGTAKVRVYSPHIDQHGWQSSHTAVEVVTDDMSFLVDSVTAELGKRGATVRLVIHPVIKVRRDAAGRLLDICDPATAAADAKAESLMHVTIDRQTSPELLEELHDGLKRVLQDVRAAVEDWPAMTAKASLIATQLGAVPANPDVATDRAELSEASAFVSWLLTNHFTFLGYRLYRLAGAETAALLDVDPGSGLGILRNDQVRVFDGLRELQELPPEVQFFVLQPIVLRVTKSNRRATVHRPVHLDGVFLKAFDETGRIIGEHLFVGLFTSLSYSRMVPDVPYLRQKVERVLKRAGFPSRSHDGKILAHILGTYPRDELFQISEDELFEISIGILHLQDRQRTALFVRRDPFERFISCIVFVPRDRYDTPMRMRIQKILVQAFNGDLSTFYTQIAESPLARLNFIIKTTPGQIPAFESREIEAQLIEAVRAWSDRLRDALVEAHGEENGLRLASRYADAFPTSYSESYSADAAVVDIERIETTVASGRLSINLYRPLEAAEPELRIKIYHGGEPVPLSEILPMLEHMDLTVVTERPFQVVPSGHHQTVWIHDFDSITKTGGAVDVAAIKAPFQEALERVWSGRMESDGFNRLVLRAGLSWREVTILRAQAKYLRQAGIPFSQDYMESTFANHPAIARMIVALFYAQLDPVQAAEAEQRCSASLDTLAAALEEVSNLDEDRILRRFVNLTRSTLRTNFFQCGADGAPKPYLSFKLDSAALDELPLPRPMFEVSVYSPRVEGIHLRGGKVARGGIRWSDRREDFRTEILGLIKAQMVKNTVIVPVGSKGGFVVKRPPPASAGREAVLAEGIECYKTLMRGLLDVTDTLTVDGGVLPPPDVVRRDGDDPYLVVAADKGTATFSDIANGVSQEYRFWLDDAFASGGSVGYDHKKMGITARGAWESVKRHFRELGLDCQSQDFTCIGVGDMAGDVFGNGMLLSEHTRLVGAFNHMHVFCDPDPDPAVSFAERRRLFELPRSSWADYDKTLISKGGGIFLRQAKSIPISREMKERFGLDQDHMTPADLIRTMLRAPTDLLFFGGIGTFVKAHDESHADVGDKANDALRIDAEQLRVKVVGEGANLGMTQRARIAAAMRGVRLNTDAIDNSAGVDTSDHEVNIKILLGDVMARGDLTLKQRNELLAAMTDEVGALVLADNYLQSQALTVAQSAAAELLEQHARFMRALEKAGRLSRTVELLPDDEELGARAHAHQGLTRPELAVLLAYGKITLYDDLLASDLPDEASMVEELVRYFPRALRRQFRPAIERHRLRREIIATAVTNSMVNRVGPTFVQEMIERSGFAAVEIARSYIVAREAFELRPIWRAIEGLDNLVPAATQTAMLQETARLLDRTVGWLLTNATHPLDITAEIDAYRPGVEALAAILAEVLAPDAKLAFDERTAELTRDGVPLELAQRVAALPTLAPATDIIRIAKASHSGVPAVAAVYFTIGHRFGSEWLRRRARKVKTENHWQKQAVAAIVDDLYAHQRQLTSQVLEHPGENAVEAWIATRRAAVDRLDQLLTDLHAAPTIDLAMLAVANRQLRGLFGG